MIVGGMGTHFHNVEMSGQKGNLEKRQKLTRKLSRRNEDSLRSKETYGQTRGLSNLEMKHVGKLAIIGALLKAKQA